MTHSGSIPERVRAQLLALGIPASQHSPDALAGMFPREFNLTVAELTTEDLARVLVHFVSNGIISVAGSGTKLKNVEPGWHACQFYRDKQQLLGLVAPYVAEGIANGESCLWVVPNTVTNKAAYDALAPLLPHDVESYVARGQLEVRPHEGWYLDAARRFKSFEDIAGALLDKQDRALANGFKFLRAAGDAGWVSGTDESRAFIDYEMKVNAALGATKVAAVCTYRADVTADELIAIVTAHQDSLLAAAA
jgi:hypothetical protein